MVGVEVDRVEQNRLLEYLDLFGALIGDTRTQRTFGGVIEGILGAGSLCCARIAASSPTLTSAGSAGERRVRRMIGGDSTKRSVLTEEALVGTLQLRGVQQLAGADEVWIALDMSELRKPYAQAMEALMDVRTLKGERLVPGYRTLTALGMSRGGRRGILYHHLFSSHATEFVSEPQEIHSALASIHETLGTQAGPVTYLLDRGFDDDEVWGRIWTQNEHLVCRVKHFERLVLHQDGEGVWSKVPLSHLKSQVRHLAECKTEMLVRKQGQKREKRQEVIARIAACPVRVWYRPPGAPRYPSARQQKDVWLVRVELHGAVLEDWWLLTDWPITDVKSAMRVFRQYRQRWAVEDAFKFAKDVLGWEDMQLLNFEHVQTLSALGWIAAGFLYELGLGLEEPAINFLIRLAGGEVRPNRPPGRTILTRGLRRLLDHFVVDDFLHRERQKGPLPPQIAVLLRERSLLN